MLRREGYSGPITMLSADDAGPRDWVQRRGAQRLSGAQTEAGVVPRATDGIRHQHPLGEWAVVMGVLRADREERSTGSSQHPRLARDVPHDHAAPGKMPERAPLSTVGPV